MIWLTPALAGFLDGTEDAMLQSADRQSGDLQGSVVSGGYDLTGDGLDDVVVSAPLDDSGRGSVYLWPGDVELTTYTKVVAPTRIAGDHFGDSLDLVPDMDGDGLAELLIGAPAANNGKGAVYLFAGHSGGPTFDQMLTISTAGAGDQLGYRVSPAGDLNGDGHGDVAASAISADGGLGDVWVFLGDSDGSPDGTKVDVTASGRYYFGQALELAGDVDGDGLDDLLVGGGLSTGSAAWVVYGGTEGPDTAKLVMNSTEFGFGSFGSGAGDLDADGFADFAVSDPFTGDEAGEVYLFFGSSNGVDTSRTTPVGLNLSPGSLAGHGIAGVGDMDLDGYDELVVGAWGNGEGLGAVLYGGAGGLSGETHIVKPSSSTVSTAGYWASGAGDVNGDGHPDFLLGTGKDGALLVLGCKDEDLDGVCLALDCDDTDESIGAELFTIYKDGDGDGFGAGDPMLSCGEAGWVEDNQDCDDEDGDVHPGAEEKVGDNVDQDCNGEEICWVDADGDGYHAGETFIQPAVCPGMPQEGDCDDGEGTISPLAQEICGDGIDQDCDSLDPACADTGDSWPDSTAPSGEWQLTGSSGGCGHVPGGAWLLGLLLLHNRACRRS